MTPMRALRVVIEFTARKNGAGGKLCAFCTNHLMGPNSWDATFTDGGNPVENHDPKCPFAILKEALEKSECSSERFLDGMENPEGKSILQRVQERVEAKERSEKEYKILAAMRDHFIPSLRAGFPEREDKQLEDLVWKACSDALKEAERKLNQE